MQWSAIIGAPTGDYPELHFVAEIQLTDYR